jgi:hypothetical protein
VRRRRLAAVLVVLVAVGGLVSLLESDDAAPPRRLAPQAGGIGLTEDPLAYDQDRRQWFESGATEGLSHALYAHSPGGVVATARRTARWRPLIDRVAKPAGLDPATLEAIVFLESAGRPDITAGGGGPDAASGLVQILPGTAQSLLAMHVDLERSKRLSRQLSRAADAGDAKRIRRLVAARRRADERFDPAKALAGAVRYLRFARGRLGRDDLAVVSYHMGVGNLEGVVRAYAEKPGSGPVAGIVEDDGLSYAQLYFDSSPLIHAEAWRRLARLGDDSANYYWRILAAKDAMTRYRKDPGALAELEARHDQADSAEVALRPPGATPMLADGGAVDDALDDGKLLPLPDRPDRWGFRIGGELARAEGDDARRSRALRPDALALLGYLARGTQTVGGTRATLTVLAATRSRAAEEAAPAALDASDLHPSGEAFDVSRHYASRRQAIAFQFMLDRLQALGLIAWTRDAQTIHIVAGPRAAVLIEPLLVA